MYIKKKVDVGLKRLDSLLHISCFTSSHAFKIVNTYGVGQGSARLPPAILCVIMRSVKNRVANNF